MQALQAVMAALGFGAVGVTALIPMLFDLRDDRCRRAATVPAPSPATPRVRPELPRVRRGGLGSHLATGTAGDRWRSVDPHADTRRYSEFVYPGMWAAWARR